MWPFTKKQKDRKNEPVDVSKPVENPALLSAFRRHIEERSESSALALGQALNSSVYLIPIIADEMNTTPSGPGKVTIKTGSLIKFMNCQNEKGESFLPAFTDWNEIRKWVSAEVSTIVMPSEDLWEFVLNDKYYAGVAINPASVAWTLFQPNIQALIEDASMPNK